ncbi:DUF3081 domain-containing protein [Aliidiomarina minuta]|uniref:DUF3081 domain-containing protein n=1 Tax=Aliidiomarina minuta TaxID=880057 RepID=A0A432W3I7_9GAMM|nr:DUF3081 domain-containing protein [Aliidiomarina minuta]RUO23898.1 DUF3081 domain-containing protein [Aliidiomarina minuta]
MKNELDTREILAVFEKIRNHGELKDERYQLAGVTAFTDHDGYTVFMEDASVKLRTGFHNTYHLDYSSQRDAENFLKKLHQIDRDYE